MPSNLFTRIKVKTRAKILPIGLLIILLLIPVSALADEPPPAEDPFIPSRLDLTVDENGDGEPDELVAVLEYLDQVYREARENPGPEAEARQRTALQAFANSLPYSDETRALQKQIWEIQEEIFAMDIDSGEDEEEIFLRYREMLELERQMYEDPNFAYVDRFVGDRLSAAFRAKVNNGEEESEEATPAHAVRHGTVGDVEAANSPPIMAWVSMAQDLFIPDACASGSPPNYGSLVRGDILFINGGFWLNNFLYAKKFSHIGMYDATATKPAESVYEANPLEGVAHRPLAIWENNDDACVSITHNVDVQPWQREHALNWALSQFGTDGATPYNYNILNKTTNK